MTSPSPYAGDRLAAVVSLDATAAEGVRLARELLSQAVDEPSKRLAREHLDRCLRVLGRLP